DVVLLQVPRERGNGIAGLRRPDLEHLARHRLLKTVYARDAILDLENGSDLLNVELMKVGRFNLSKQDVLDLTRAERRVGCHTQGPESASSGWRALVKNITSRNSRKTRLVTLTG